MTTTEVSVPALSAFVPMAHVASVPRSVAFYERLGFQVDNTFTPPDQTEPSFAWLQSGGASLMVVRASAPIDPAQQAVILTLYCAGRAGVSRSSTADGSTGRRDHVSARATPRQVSHEGSGRV
jgi:hypothetical protein